MRKAATLIFGFLPLAFVAAEALGITMPYLVAVLFGLAAAGLTWLCPYWKDFDD